jgi:histidinol dehydrogenase
MLASHKLSPRDLVAQPEDPAKIRKNVSIILQGLQAKGEKALSFYAQLLGHFPLKGFEVSETEFANLESKLSPQVKKWLSLAIFEAQKFYGWPRENRHKIEVSPGVTAWHTPKFPQSVGIAVENEGFADLGGFLNLAVLCQIHGIEPLVCAPASPKGQADPYLAYLANKMGIRLFKAPLAVGVGAMALGIAPFAKVERVMGRVGEYGFEAGQLLGQQGLKLFGYQPLLILADSSADLEKLSVDVALYQNTFPKAKIAACFLQNDLAEKFASLLRAKVLWTKRKDPRGDFPNLILTRLKSEHDFFELVDSLDSALVVVCAQQSQTYHERLPAALSPYYHSCFLLNGSFVAAELVTQLPSISNRSLGDISSELNQDLFNHKLESDLDVTA